MKYYCYSKVCIFVFWVEESFATGFNENESWIYRLLQQSTGKVLDSTYLLSNAASKVCLSNYYNFCLIIIRSPFSHTRVLFMSGCNVLLKHSYTLHVPFFAYSFFGSFSLTYNGNNNNNNNNNLIYRCFSTEPIALYNSEWSRKVSNIRSLKKRNNEWFLQFKEISKKVRLKSGFKRFCWLAKFYT